jgi:hypothetical protein
MALLAFEIQAPSVDQLPMDDTGPGFYDAATTSLVLRRLKSGINLPPVGRRMRGRLAVATSW